MHAIHNRSSPFPFPFLAQSTDNTSLLSLPFPPPLPPVTYAVQHHENLDIYKKSFALMDRFFPEEDEAAETGIGAPQVDAAGSFAFQSDIAAPQGGFSFGQ
jgi:hypothetical protein